MDTALLIKALAAQQREMSHFDTSPIVNQFRQLPQTVTAVPQ